MAFVIVEVFLSTILALTVLALIADLGINLVMKKETVSQFLRRKPVWFFAPTGIVSALIFTLAWHLFG